MTKSPSPRIVSTQDQPHPGLETTVRKHLSTRSTRPPSEHTRTAFEEAAAWRSARASQTLIIDSGCGRGDSTHAIAQRHPDAAVIGIDKSFTRLSKTEPATDNVLFLRANLVDFYRLAADAEWQLSHHFILYPNPWPKPGHLSRRWHGAPVFRDILALGGVIELRTNWPTYAEEFDIALSIAGCEPTRQVGAPLDAPLTLHERKYLASGHTITTVKADLTERSFAVSPKSD